MKVFARYHDVPEAYRGMSVAMGNFDGVHAGHRAVLDAARAAGKGDDLAVATFEPPPRAYFRPNDAPFRLYRPDRRNARLEELGVSAVFELPFGAEIASMTDEDFARRVLRDGLGASHITVGFDFRFGRGRMGDAGRLSSLGRACGFGVTIVEKMDALGNKASSTAIREALIAGHPEHATEILGRNWVVDAIVEEGEKRGRTIGFPTANMQLGELLHPRHGVYAVRCRIEGKSDWINGVANFGRTPTTGLRDPLLEAHLFDFDGDLYGLRLEVALVAYLRPELKFDSVEEMIPQMHKDADAARQVLA